MLGAFARASIILDEEKYRAAAEKNVAFIREKLWQSPQGGAGSPLPAAAPQSDDGAHGVTRPTGIFTTAGATASATRCSCWKATRFCSTGWFNFTRPRWIHAFGFRHRACGRCWPGFYDAANGGFWQSPAGMNDLILRMKDDYDGAEPSGNSVATLALLKLAAITGREDFRQPAEATLQLFAQRLQKQPAALAFMLQALDFWLDEPRRVVIAGDTIPRIFTNCFAPRIRFTSRTKLFWATSAPLSCSPKPCREKMKPRFIFARGIPVSRQRAMRRRSKKCCIENRAGSGVHLVARTVAQPSRLRVQAPSRCAHQKLAAGRHRYPPARTPALQLNGKPTYFRCGCQMHSK